MRYQDAITDRTQTDITNKTSKAYFNVADWLRVYYNALNAYLLTQTQSGETINFTPVLTHPLITSFPDVDDFNTILSNLEELRGVVINTLGVLNTLSTPVKHDWQTGLGEAAPIYTDVNLWETVASTIYLNIATAAGFTDWVTPTDPGTRRHRTNVGICGADITRNNGFVRY